MSAGQHDKLTVSRDLALLAPRFRAAVEAAIQECNAKGLDAFVYEGFRSAELQALYFARGRTVIPPARPVTNARSNLFSWHGYGLAVDVISRAHGWNRPESWFKQVAEIFARHQCKWGGEWKMKDLPHFQWHLCRPSPSDRARELLRSGGVQAVWQAVGAADGAAPSAAAAPQAEITPSAPLGATGRVLFERSPTGFRAVRGELVRRIQEALQRAGFSPGSLDGIFGGDTERAVLAWQAAAGAVRTGKIDVPAWLALVPPAVPSVFERSLQVTAAFEGHGFGKVAGNFDDAWLTWGIIGFNLRRGSLGPLLREIRATHPPVFRDAFGPLEAELVHVLNADEATQQEWSNRISIGPQRYRVLARWEEAFDRLGRTPEAQALQLRFADSYWRTALRDADRFDLRTELGLALCFDIAVQNGGINQRKEEAIRARLRVLRPETEGELRVIIANAVAENSRPQYIEDVRSRKLALATGVGLVHGARYNVQSWGLDDVAAGG